MAHLRLGDMSRDVSHELLQPVEGIAAIVPLALQIELLLSVKVPPLELRGSSLAVTFIFQRFGNAALAFLGDGGGGVAVVVEGDNLQDEGRDVLVILGGEDSLLHVDGRGGHERRGVGGPRHVPVVVGVQGLHGGEGFIHC